MEKNLSLELQDSSPPSQREIVHPSLVQRTMRSIFPILLGSAVVATTIPFLPVEGKDPVKEERKEEDPRIAALRAQMTKLIADLESEKFTVREAADKELREIAIVWIQREKKSFPLAGLLLPKDGHSFEQKGRLRRVYDAQEQEELALLWRPTVFQEPPEWIGRKEAPRVSEVLKALEKQTGQRIFLEGQKYFTDGMVVGELKGQTFWEVLERVRLPAGGKFDMYRSSNGSLCVYPEHHGVYAIGGSVLGRAYVRHDRTRTPKCVIPVSFLTESIALGDASIIKTTGTTDKGRKLVFEEEKLIDPLGRVWPRIPGRSTHLVMSFEKGEQSIDLTVTALLRGYETRVESVKDLTKIAKFPVGSYELKIVGISKSNNAQPEYWSVHAELLGKDNNEDEKRCLMNALQCLAFDGKGGLIEVSGNSVSSGECKWDFRAQPHSIELVLPGRGTTSEKTFVFKGIPLHR